MNYYDRFNQTQNTLGTPCYSFRLPHALLEEGIKEFHIPFSHLFKYNKNESTIPPILHHIWLTPSGHPREIDAKHLDNIISTKKLFNNNWQHIVWTNHKNLIPESNTQLKIEGIKLRELEEQLNLYKYINEYTEMGKTGISSNIARYSIMQKYGGVYSDLNFKFNRPIDEDIKKYDFLNKEFEVSFFAAKPYHPIISASLELIERNFLTPPEYIKHIQTFSGGTSPLTSWPFRIALLKKINIDGNQDAVYPTTKKKEQPEPNNKICLEKDKLYDELCHEPQSEIIDDLINSLLSDNVLVMSGEQSFDFGIDIKEHSWN